ncbi:MAG TPA: D-arabinono-1,4-lactone oxidase [Pseudomonadales bacterium]|nr:D-arabinono-1,4-lactone oxidase [Pseudomonadales bacterium]
MSAVEDDGWRNWSGAIHCPGQGLERPADSAALCALVDGLGAGERIRAVGSGHSFVPFWAPGDRLVDLGAFTGLRGVAEGEGGDVAVVGAGTPIHVLGPLLAAAGRALANQGDIDRQTLAGAISTGTHGTGRGLGSLSSMVSHLVLVDGTGTERRIAGEALPAARVSLGLFGIITEIGIRTVPLYGLHERNHRESVQSCLEALEARFETHRHHEFWWVPSEDLCIAKTLDAIEVPQASRTGEIAFGADGERWGAAWEVFPSARDARFNEMEYAVPAAAGPDCFRALRTAMLDAFPKLPWPIEYRIVAGDDGWLSPTAGVEVAAISVHQDARRDPAPLFDLAEPILRAHGGRPHWGKVQRLAATELADLYPRLGDFAETRRRLDPRDRFLGPWLRTLLPGA